MLNLHIEKHYPQFNGSKKQCITGGRQVCGVEKQPFAHAALSFCLISSVLVLYTSADVGRAQGFFFLLHFLFVVKLFILGLLSEQDLLEYLCFLPIVEFEKRIFLSA